MEGREEKTIVESSTENTGYIDIGLLFFGLWTFLKPFIVFCQLANVQNNYKKPEFKYIVETGKGEQNGFSSMFWFF